MKCSIDRELFTKNLLVLRKVFPMQPNEMRALGAMITTAYGKECTIEGVKAANAVLKENLSIFSAFRDDIKLPMTVKMYLSGDPEAYLKGVLNAYELLSADFLFGSQERALAATVLYENTDPSEREAVAAHALEVYKKMRKEHPILTSQADLTFAVMIAKDPSFNRLAETEKCYDLLKKNFIITRDALQTSAGILSLSSKPAEEKAERFMELFNAFKEEHLKFRDLSLAVLAVLTNSDLSVEEIVRITKDNYEFIKTQKGMGVMGSIGSMRKMLAAAITAMENMPEGSQATDATASAILSIIIQIEITIMIMAVSAAIGSAHSTSTGN